MFSHTYCDRRYENFIQATTTLELGGSRETSLHLQDPLSRTEGQARSIGSASREGRGQQRARCSPPYCTGMALNQVRNK